MKIAFEYYGDVYKWRTIYEANRARIPNPHAVPPGTQLTIEKPVEPVQIDRTGEKYLIRPGDHLGKISTAIYGTCKRWKEIWEKNKLLIRDPNHIFSGFYIYYQPSGRQPQSQVPNNAQSQAVPAPAEQQTQLFTSPLVPAAPVAEPVPAAPAAIPSR
jgi:hypothetical protein